MNGSSISICLIIQIKKTSQHTENFQLSIHQTDFYDELKSVFCVSNNTKTSKSKQKVKKVNKLGRRKRRVSIDVREFTL